MLQNSLFSAMQRTETEGTETVQVDAEWMAIET
jgi:hypothetical protein